MPIPDGTYQGGTGVYREQGGNRIVVGTAGEIILGTSDVAKLDASGLTFGTSGGAAAKVTASVTTATLSSYGISTVAATSAAGAQQFTLGAPVTGVRKTIVCTVANITDTCTIYSGSNVGMNNSGVTAFNNKYVFKAPGVLELLANSTANYIICTPNVSTVGYSTS